MNFDRRIWKTGVMAVVATMIFALVIFRAEEWTRGLNSEFIAYGQTGGTGGTGGGTGGAGSSLTKIIPQIVVGSFDNNLTKYITVIQISNIGSAPITVSGNVYTTAGGPSKLSIKAGAASFSNGIVPSTQLEGNGTLVFTADTADTGTVNWARFSTTGSVALSSYFEFRDVANNTLYTRVGIPASAGDMASFVIPRARNVAAGFDMGFALVNTGSTTASITGVARDAAGAVLASRVFSLAPLNHTATFAREFFTATGCSPCLGTEASGTTYGTVTFTSTSAQFAATALSIEGGALASTALERLQ